MDLLEIRELSIAFAGLRALERVSFVVREGEILGLIGPNGAGKSTLLNCVSRVYTPTAGSIRYRGEDILHKAVHELPELGIRRTFQNLELFKDATVRENVVMGTAFRYRPNVAAYEDRRREFRHLPKRGLHRRSSVPSSMPAPRGHPRLHRSCGPKL